ncbi:MAG: hypothetical protein ACE37F_27045 [Nannocystaceae bacterium]|nr:hypothetical protein [bacterium]
MLVACRPAPGTGAPLAIEVAPEDVDADVYVDGNYVGQVGSLTAAGAEPLVLAPGVHRLEVRKPGRFPVQRTIRVEGGPNREPVVVNAELLEDPR